MADWNVAAVLMSTVGSSIDGALASHQTDAVTDAVTDTHTDILTHTYQMMFTALRREMNLSLYPLPKPTLNV